MRIIIIYIYTPPKICRVMPQVGKSKKDTKETQNQGNGTTTLQNTDPPPNLPRAACILAPKLRGILLGHRDGGISLGLLHINRQRRKIHLNPSYKPLCRASTITAHAPRS